MENGGRDHKIFQMVYKQKTGLIKKNTLRISR